MTNTDPHKIFLSEIGKTEDEWRRLSKSERKRLKYQHEHAMRDQNVNEQIESTDDIMETPEQGVENNPVVEETTAANDNNDGVNENDESVEEAVVSADM